MADYWTAINILRQTTGELGLDPIASIATATDRSATQLVALLNSAGNDLLLYYPWQQFAKQWEFNTGAVDPTGGYIDLPDDWSYFRDQTQWDRTDHWPLLGPKSPQEWAWLKGSLVAALPRQRYRVMDNRFYLWPVPVAPYVDMAMEYVSENWIEYDDGTFGNMILTDGDIVMFNPWLMVKFLKLKFYELKGFPTGGVSGDFLRTFNSLTGKDVGGQILSLSPRYTNQYLGPWSVPDGSWNVN